MTTTESGHPADGTEPSDTVADGLGSNGAEAGPHERGTPVALPAVRPDDPHLQPAAQHPVRVSNIIVVSFLIGIAGMVGFGYFYWTNDSPWKLGLSLGVGLTLLGFGLTAWGKYLMPQGPFVEERHDLSSSQAERDAMAAALTQRTGLVMKRRGVLGGLLAAGLAVFGVVIMFPLLRSLGPLPKKTLTQTNWRKGSLLVDSDGRAIHVGSMVPGGIQTVFPAGYENNDQTASQDQTVLIRLLAPVPPYDWSPDGYIAYSKLCTHLGCPVGLYEQELELLVCPCHQSMFKVAEKGVPEFGPAPRPLPQLPLQIDSSGYLRAAAGYDQPVGPGYWER